MTRNIPQRVDDYFRLYAPIYTHLLLEFPKAHGATGCIEWDEPIVSSENIDLVSDKIRNAVTEPLEFEIESLQYRH